MTVDIIQYLDPISFIQSDVSTWFEKISLYSMPGITSSRTI